MFTQWSANFIRKSVAQKKPFFCYLAYNAVHGPIRTDESKPASAPKEWVDKALARGVSFLRSDYVAILEHMDYNIGKLVDLIDELKKIIEENNIKGIIIGYPINMDGSLGPSAQSVNDVSKNIDQNVDVDVCLWDERLSTVGAFNLSSQLDVNVSKREKNIDQNAAAFILQGAIDYLNN